MMSTSNEQLDRSYALRDTIRKMYSNSSQDLISDEDLMYLHILDSIGALRNIQKKNRNDIDGLKKSKRRVF